MPTTSRLGDMLRSRTVLCCFVAMFFISGSGAVLNTYVYASIAPYFGIGREILTLMGGVAFLAVVLIGMKKPSLFDVRQISLFVVPLLVLGGFFLALALERRDPLFVLVALVCRVIGNSWAITVFTAALATIASGRTVLVVIGSAMVASGVSWYVIPSDLPMLVACLILMACSLVPILTTYKISMPVFQTIRQGGAASNLGVSGMTEFKNLHSLFFCVLLVSLASGYSLTFSEQFDAPIATVVENVVLGGIIVFVLMARREKENDGRENQLFSFAALLIIAGFLMAPFSFGEDTVIIHTLLRLGRDCFNMLVWLVIVSVGQRNIFMLLPVLGATRFMSSLGTDLGAMAGRMTNSLIYEAPVAAEAITASIAFIFIAFLWLGFRNFSFSQAIVGVKEVAEPEMLRIGDYISERCRSLGQQHGLTDREAEILVLLAKGRDGRFIAEEYVLSYNTVKTHIKHLYQKLGVHSRQELIDLVGGDRRAA